MPHRLSTLSAKIAATAAVICLVEALVLDAAAFLWTAALGWIVALIATRPALRRSRAALVALAAATLFVAALFDDPSELAVLLFLVAIVLAALLPRRRFDTAIAWGLRLAWTGLTALLLPIRDVALTARARTRRARPGIRPGAVAAMLALPIAGGALFLTLFAQANPLIESAFAGVVLPDIGVVLFRGVIAIVVLLPVWATLRPDPRGTGWDGALPAVALPQVGSATLILSLATFNTIFAIQNALDLAFLWSGAPLPAGVTMADYAHRGAYALIVTALLAGLFVLVTLRPGSPGAASPAVRRLVTLWILQNVLLVASSALRTLDYVDAYSMTVLRLSALIWMALVATGLILILWRLLGERSATWLVNANALAAAVVLTGCTLVDLRATAAAWNVDTAIRRHTPLADLDLCYLDTLGPSAILPLARLEQATHDPAARDAIAALRWQAQQTLMWQDGPYGWSWRGARRLARVQAMMGATPPRLRPAPNGRRCGIIAPPPEPAPAPAPLTKAPQR